MGSCNLIVNADDLGITEAVSDGIFEGFSNGIITAASLMVNGSAFRYAVDQLQHFPDLDVGLHLTLVEERPVSETSRVKSLIGTNGRFLPHARQFLNRYISGKIAFLEVHEEFSAQIYKARAAGVTISHIDTHQHLHCLPKIRKIVVDLAKEHKIQCMRYPKERLQPYMVTSISHISRVVELCVLNTLSKQPRIYGLQSSDEMLGFFFGGNLGKQNLLKVLGHLKTGQTYELMCHPGKVDADSMYAHWNYNWQEELDALQDAEVRDFLIDHQINLIKYKDLN
jgi:predicted glycoside hydrolase/deacetylase ChbG (UPF0249 family)